MLYCLGTTILPDWVSGLSMETLAISGICKVILLNFQWLSRVKAIEASFFQFLLYRFLNSLASLFFFPPMTHCPPVGPGRLHYRGFTMILRHTTLGRTPLDEWSARRRGLYLANTQLWQVTDIHVTGWIRTRNSIMRAAVDPRLRRRCPWDHTWLKYLKVTFAQILYSLIEVLFVTVLSSLNCLQFDVKRLAGILEVPGSKLILVVCCLQWRLSGLPLSLQANKKILIYIRPRTFPFQSIAVQNLLIFPLSNAICSSLLGRSQNKPRLNELRLVCPHVPLHH